MDTGSIAFSLAAAAFIGFVVSLDVGGLLISQHTDFKDTSYSDGKAILVPALYHALTHSILFLLYYFIVQGLIWISIKFPDLIELIVSYLTFLPELDKSEVIKTTLLLSSLVVISFVWITYSVKIVENHRDKLADSGDPLGKSRLDIQLIYQISKTFLKNNTGRIQMAWLLAVAVDMLAISSFIRVYFKGALDSGGDRQQNESGDLFHFNFGLPDYLDPILFGVIVFATVFICAIGAIAISKSISGEKHLTVLTWLRIAEPFLVFWILVYAIEHLFGSPMEKPEHAVPPLLLSCAASAALTGLMVWMRSYKNIREAVALGANVSIAQVHDNAENTDYKKVTKIFLWLVFALMVTLALLVITFYLSHQRPAPGQPMITGTGLNNFVQWLSIVINVLVVLILYTPILKVSQWEMKINKFVFPADDNTRSKRMALLCSGAAYFVILLDIHMSYVGMDIFTARPEENFLQPLIYIGLIVVSAGALSIFRQERQRALAEASGVELGAVLSIGEGLNSLAVVLFIFQALIYFGGS